MKLSSFRIPHSACRIRRGFTILEVMLAISIFAIVLTAIYATWMGILKGSKAGLKAAAEVQRSRIAMRALEDAFLTTEMFVANMKHYLFFADTSGEMAVVSLAARLPASFPGVGRYGAQVVRRVSFYTEPGKDGTYDLIMTQAPILANTNSGFQPYTLTLSRDVTLFQMEFYDEKKGEWLEEWKSTNSLPRLVKIALGLGKSAKSPNEPYDLVTSLVALPSLGVGADLQGGGVGPGGGPGQTNRGGLDRRGLDPNNPNINPGRPGNQNNQNNPYNNSGFPNQGFPNRQGNPGRQGTFPR